MLNIGSANVEYNKNFKLFLITNLPNPHFAPEVLAKATLLNFTSTPDALKDQMLSILTKEEDPLLEEEKLRLMRDT